MSRGKPPEHEFDLKDLTVKDLSEIKSMAMQKFFMKKKTSQVTLIAEAFMGFLASRGYKIVKVKDE